MDSKSLGPLRQIVTFLDCLYNFNKHVVISFTALGEVTLVCISVVHSCEITLFHCFICTNYVLIVIPNKTYNSVVLPTFTVEHSPVKVGHVQKSSVKLAI
jgi:hypothetical protein